jgi:acyl-homoserine lactone acylase PvdQ
LSQACDREIRFQLPKLNKYFADDTFFEFGTYNLEIKTRDQKSSCVEAAAGAVLTGAGSGKTAANWTGSSG